jgi:hypothetical protein
MRLVHFPSAGIAAQQRARQHQVNEVQRCPRADLMQKLSIGWHFTSIRRASSESIPKTV